MGYEMVVPVLRDAGIVTKAQGYPEQTGMSLALWSLPTSLLTWSSCTQSPSMNQRITALQSCKYTGSLMPRPDREQGARTVT